MYFYPRGCLMLIVFVGTLRPVETNRWSAVTVCVDCRDVSSCPSVSPSEFWSDGHNMEQPATCHKLQHPRLAGGTDKTPSTISSSCDKTPFKVKYLWNEKTDQSSRCTPNLFALRHKKSWCARSSLITTLNTSWGAYTATFSSPLPSETQSGHL